MSALVLWAVCFGLGAILLFTSQPVGAPKRSLAQRLRALRPDATVEESQASKRVFRTRLLEEVIRPVLERWGEVLADFGARIGVSGASVRAKLTAGGDEGGLPLFYGQKLASLLIGVLILPLAESMGLGPRLAPWVWLGFGVVAFFFPDALLSARVRSRRMVLTEGSLQASELFALAVASGLGLEQAIDEVAEGGSGPFFEELRRSLKETRIAGGRAGAALQMVAERTGLPEAASLSAAVGLAERGAPLVQTLRAQAQTMRQRGRILLLESGERAQIRIVLATGIFILPAFFVLVLYPAAVHLVQVAAP